MMCYKVIYLGIHCLIRFDSFSSLSSIFRYIEPLYATILDLLVAHFFMT